jgi:hypothetical protein
MGEGASSNLGKLGIRELGYLFGLNSLEADPE